MDLFLCFQTDAFSFYQEYNGLKFNSLENAFCTLLFVERIETVSNSSLHLM